MKRVSPSKDCLQAPYDITQVCESPVHCNMNESLVLLFLFLEDQRG